MAPRKQNPPEATASPAALAHKGTRVTKSKGVTKAHGSKKLSNRLTEKRRKRPIVRHSNGLVYLEKTPDDLVAVAVRNATESPLLHLPPELRNLIWKFAMGGNIVHGPNFWGSLKGGAVPHVESRASQSYKIPSAFHLPEVSRQIYSETTTLAYKHNIFGMRDHGRLEFAWMLPAHRNAITAVALTSDYLADCVFHNRRKHMLPRDLLPNIKSVNISADAVDFVRHDFWEVEDPEQHMTRNSWQEWIRERLSMHDAKDVQLNFDEGDEFKPFSASEDEVDDDDDEEYWQTMTWILKKLKANMHRL